jgi:hypothetical protein
MSLFTTSKSGIYWTLGPKALSGVLMRGASPGGLAKTACSRPLDDEVPAMTCTGPHVLSCLPWSADDAENGGSYPEYTLPSGVHAHYVPRQRPSDVTCVFQKAQFAASVLVPDTNCRTVSHVFAPGDARETVDDGPTPWADPWALAPTASGASLAFALVTANG